MPKDNKGTQVDVDSFVEANQTASDENAKLKEAEIKTYDEAVPGRIPQEDIPEISSTDDV